MLSEFLRLPHDKSKNVTAIDTGQAPWKELIIAGRKRIDAFNIG